MRGSSRRAGALYCHKTGKPFERGSPLRVPWPSIPAWLPTRFNARYHTAWRLVEVVLRATSVKHEPEGVVVNGVWLDVPRLFGDFVIVAKRGRSLRRTAVAWLTRIKASSTKSGK